LRCLDLVLAETLRRSLRRPWRHSPRQTLRRRKSPGSDRVRATSYTSSLQPVILTLNVTQRRETARRPTVERLSSDCRLIIQITEEFRRGLRNNLVGGNFRPGGRPAPRTRRLNDMMTHSHSWAMRLAERRARTFVGREAELRVLRGVLEPRELAFQVIALVGPPGCGKTTLLRLLSTECHEAGVPHAFIDARAIQPSTD